MEGESPVRPIGATRKELRDAAYGNITIDEIVNRARYDDTFIRSKFAVLIEDTLSPPLCDHYTWGSGVCLYGARCRYSHNPDMILRYFGDAVVYTRGPLASMKRRPFESILTGNPQNNNRVAYIEYQGRVVWFRDGGKKSAELWEKCLEHIHSRRAQLRAIASSVGGMDTVSQGSVPEYIELLELLLEDNFEALFAFLDIQDIVELFIAFVGNSFVREDLRTCLLSPLVWETVVAMKWSQSFRHFAKPISSFLEMRGATIEAHAQLVSSSIGLFTHGGGSGDPHPAKGLCALSELSSRATPGKTVLVSEEGNAVSSVRFTNSLIAIANGNEVSIFRTGDLVKVGTCKQKGACELVTIPQCIEGNVLVHAGSTGIYFRDLDEPNLKIQKKIPLQTDHTCVSLEAVNHSVFLGIRGNGLYRYSSENGQLIAEAGITGFRSSRMWSKDGRLHATINQPSDAQDSGIVSLYDFRAKAGTIIACSDSVPLCMGTAGFNSNLIAVGSVDGCKLFDVRKPESGPVWSVLTSCPVRDISLTDRTVCLFESSPNQNTTVISTYSNTWLSEPVRIGSHTIPFKVSTIGFSSDGGQAGSGCIYAVKRPKRSGRGDNGILCVGGSAFVDKSKFNRSRRTSSDLAS